MEFTNTGKVKFYNKEKSFGFITDKASGKDVFVHSTGTMDRIETDDEVSFNVETGDRGLKCVNVKRIKK